jgi:hypothetical protein
MFKTAITRIWKVFTRRKIEAVTLSAIAAISAVGIVRDEGFGAETSVSAVPLTNAVHVAAALESALDGGGSAAATSVNKALDLPNLAHPRVDSWIRKFTTSQRGSFATYLKRMTRYESMISRKLAERDMPQGLIYLAMIESGFNPTAKSRVAATGLWQFMRATGREYGLKVSGRLDAAGRPASFSWRELVNRKPATESELRRIVEIKPVLDYTALEPGQAATAAIREAASGLDPDYRARVRLTGPVPIQDEEFGTLKENAELNALVSLGFLIGILWLALHSWRIIIAVLVSIFAGLAFTMAIGLMLVDSLNPISIAFAVLFVGIGVDFGIQYSVRYRAERFEVDNLRDAQVSAARHVGVPLTLAATATALGFMSFLPTHYRGLSELGQIAGMGMIIAFLVTITLLPALLQLLNPPGEKEPLGYKSLAPVDSFMERHRVAIIVGTAVISIGGLPLLYFLQFDFNPINLRSPKVESIATYLDLKNDPNGNANGIDILASSPEEARQIAERLRKLPEVERVMTLDTFIPEDQQQKLALIQKLAKALGPALGAKQRPAPSDEETIAALNRGADALNKVAGDQTGPGAEAARRLAKVLTAIAKGDQALRERATVALVAPLRIALDGLRTSLKAEQVTRKNLPPELAESWITSDDRLRVEVHPKGDPNDNEVLRQFARAVLAVEPTASGGPISILESGHAVVRAFIEAGFWALVSIAVLLWIVLRRFTDVLLTLIPLLLAGVVTTSPRCAR